MNHDLLKIHELADGQLSIDDEVSVREHLKGCTECQAELTAIEVLKSVLSEKTPTVDVADSWQKCVKRLNEVDRSTRIEGFVGRYAWAFCSILLVVILSAAMINRVLGRNSLHTGDVAQMVSSLVPMPGIQNQDSKSAQKLVSQAIGPMPIAIQTTGMRFDGGIQGIYNGHRVVRLNLQDQNGPFILLVLADTEGVEGAEPVSERQRFSTGRINALTCISWTEGHFTLVLVGKRPAGELCRLADQICVR
jgi:anti-sigma factor RsiW